MCLNMKTLHVYGVTPFQWCAECKMKPRRCTAAAAKGFGEKKPPLPPKEKQMHMGNELSARQQAKKADELSTAVGKVPAETALADPEDDDVVDPRVTDRMLRRVILFSGTPVVLGLLLFPFFWYLKVVQKVELPMGTVFVSSGLAFGAGLLGISYGAISASWDPAREGSIWGWNEFRANLAAIMNQRNSR
eukprot:jgi/Ulvmu1/10593/UM065_0047.1